MALADLIAFLSDQAQKLRSVETAGLSALHDDKDEEAYFDALEEKCLLILKLADGARPFAQSLSPEIAGRVERTLTDFNRRASMAIGLESPFFMYALLYPDGWKDGDPNDLEAFIASLDAK